MLLASLFIKPLDLATENSITPTSVPLFSSPSPSLSFSAPAGRNASWHVERVRAGGSDTTEITLLDKRAGLRFR